MYFLQFALLYTLFYLAYRFGLRQTGQLMANRFYLLASYLLSAVIPLLPWPELAFLAESTATVFAPFVHADSATPLLEANTQVSNQPVNFGQTALAVSSSIDWQKTLLLTYLLGVSLVSVRYSLQLWSLRKLLRGSSPLPDRRWDGRARVIGQIWQKTIAFTYGRCFYVSPNLLNSPDAELILEHEFAHASQRHTIDLTVSELCTALLWWHPVAWLHRRDLRLNLEFLADHAVLAAGHSPKNYQLSLLRFCESFNPKPALTFAQSPLKTRITMMKSKKRSPLTYLTLLAAVLLTGSLFTTCSAQEVSTEKTLTSEVPFLKGFVGEEGWKQARSLLVNNYAGHKIEYFVNGSPAQNEIIPKPEDIKVVELAANTDAPNLTRVSFTTRQANWVSAFGWHASEENSRLKMDSYSEWTVSLISAKNNTESSSMAFYGNSRIYEGAFDYLEEEYPDAATVFYVDGDPTDIDALDTPAEDVKAIVVAYANNDRTKVIFHVITSALTR